SKYRKILCQDRILAYQTLEDSNQEPAQLTIFDGINFISEAWKQVTVETIKHSWEKTKIISDDNQ
ncbi:3396_t:CDS:1, partial [Entrophospora sp. SA101]